MSERQNRPERRARVGAEVSEWWADIADGFILAALIALIVIAERLDVARGTVALAQDAGRSDQAADTTALAGVWVVVLFLGVVAALRVRARLIREVDRTGNAAPGRIGRLEKLSALAIVAWGAWQAWGIAAVGWDWPEGPRAALHALALLLALAAVVGAGYEAVGDPGSAWRRASVVRLQLILLALLFLLVFVVPLTAAQLVDVLRGWGEQPGTRAVLGIASALLLGEVCRASSLRLLAPEDSGEPRPTRKLVAKVLFVVILVAAVLLAVADCPVGAGACVAILTVALATKWVPPWSTHDPQADDRRRSEQFAGTLSVVPLAIVFIGLVDATVDSWLLPDPGSGADWALLLVTLGVGLLFGGLAGAAHRHPQTEPDSSGHRLRDFLLAGLALLLTLLAAFGPDEIARGTFDFLWAVPLLIGAFVIALRPLEGRGNLELWVGAGVALGAAVAIYIEPIEVPRVFGAFGVTLLAAAGILLLLHGAASWSMRRAPRSRTGWRGLLPARVPAVTLLAIWIGAAAYVSATSTAHQARTISVGEGPGNLRASVLAWLDRVGGRRPPHYVPMLLVGASGGGAKAGYWTDLVMDCALGKPIEPGEKECGADTRGPRRFQRLFLTSSVSGGSAGVYWLLRNQQKATAGGPWVDRVAGPEVLSPTVGWGLFHDMPAFMLGASTDPRNCADDAVECRVEADRALVQEAAIAGQTSIEPGTGMTAPIPARPVAVFNGAIDGAEGRVLASPLELAPRRVPDSSCDTPPTRPVEPGAGSIDARDVLEPQQDVPMVTAVGLSARFPVVAPAGRLGDSTPPKDAKGCDAPGTLPPVTVRDGGYVENTGLLTITELLPQIGAAAREWAAQKQRIVGHPVHVQLIVVSIDDDPAVVDPAPKFEEARRSPLGIATRVNDKYLSRLSRNRLTSCQYPHVTYQRISPPPHVGAHAATGWELSKTTRARDLREAVTAQPGLTGSPGQVIDWLRRVLDGDLTPMDCP